MPTLTEAVDAMDRLTNAYNSNVAEFEQRFIDLSTEARENLSVVLAVNADTGQDANAGTASAPLKTVGEALSRCGRYGDHTILLQTDVTIDEIHAMPNGKLTFARNGVGSRTIRFADHRASNNTQAPGFIMAYGMLSVMLSDVDIELREYTAPTAPAAAFRGLGFIVGILRNSQVTALPNCNSTLLSGDDGVGLSTHTVTQVGDMAGHWVEGHTGETRAGTHRIAFSGIEFL